MTINIYDIDRRKYEDSIYLRDDILEKDNSRTEDGVANIYQRIFDGIKVQAIRYWGDLITEKITIKIAGKKYEWFMTHGNDEKIIEFIYEKLGKECSLKL